MFVNIKDYVNKAMLLGQARYILAGVFVFLLAVLVVGFVGNPQAYHISFAAGGNVAWAIFSMVFWVISTGLYFTNFKRFTYIVALLSVSILTVPLVGFGAWAAVIFLCLSAFACGEALCRKVFLFNKVNNLSMATAWALIIGLAVYVTCMNILVHFPVNYVVTYLCLMGIPIILNRHAVIGLMSRTSDYFTSKNWGDFWEYSAFNLIVYLLLIHFLYAAQPEQMFDALAVHLVIPHQISVQHLWSFDFINHIWAVMPMNGDWLYTMAYILGGEFAARFTNMAMLLLLLVMIVETSKQFLGRGLSYLAGALFLSSPLVHLESSSLFIENIWAVFSLAAVIVLLKYRAEKESGYLYAAMLLLGAALATKVITVFLAVILAFIIVVDLLKQRNLPGAIRGITISMVIVICVGTLPYINAYMLTENPVFPFYNAVFKSPYLDPNWSFDQPHFKQGVSLWTLYDATFHSDRYVEGTVGVPGYQYLLFLPLALVAVIRKPRHEMMTMLVIGVVFVALVFQFQSYLRYIYPIFSLFAIAIAYLFAVAQKSNQLLLFSFVTSSVVIIFINLWSMPSASAAYKNFPVKDTILGKHDTFPARKGIEFLNLTCGVHCRVGVLSGGVIAGLDGKSVTHNWHSWNFTIKIRNGVNVTAISNVVKEYKLNHLLVTDGDPNLSKAVWDFISQKCQKEYSYQGMSVYRIDWGSMQQEVLVNNDFRDGLTGWTESGKVTFNQIEGSVKVSDKNFLTQVLHVAEGTTFRTSITAKCEAENAYVRLQANWINADGQFLSATLYPERCDATYKKFTEEMEAPDGATLAIVYLVAHGPYEIDVKSLSFAGY